MLMAGLGPQPPSYESIALTNHSTELLDFMKTIFMIKVLGTLPMYTYYQYYLSFFLMS